MRQVLVEFVAVLALLAVAEGCLDMEEVALCFQDVMTLSYDVAETKSIISPEEEIQTIQHLCGLLAKGRQCLATKQVTCGDLTSTDKRNIEFYVRGVVSDGLVQLCDDTAVLAAYADHSPCIFAHQNETAQCIRVSHNKLHVLGQPSPTRINLYCRVIKELLTCGQQALESSCGYAAVQLFGKMATDFLPRGVVLLCLGKDWGSDVIEQNNQTPGAQRQLAETVSVSTGVAHRDSIVLPFCAAVAVVYLIRSR